MTAAGVTVALQGQAPAAGPGFKFKLNRLVQRILVTCIIVILL